MPTLARLRSWLRPGRDDAGPPETWTLPWDRHGDARDAAWVPVGTVGDGPLARVGPGGRLRTDAPWSLEVWVGAEDRWHFPAREVATRRSLVGSAPVVETALRVPGGDTRITIWAARPAGGERAAVAIEVGNETATPVAVAFAIRALTDRGLGRIGEISSAPLDGRAGPWVTRVDGRPALVLARAPGRTASATGDGDLLDAVSGGGAGEPHDVADPEGRTASLAHLVPVPHATSVRVAVPAEGGAGSSPVTPDELAAPEAVIEGWRSHASRGVRTEVPDTGVIDGIATVRSRLVLLGVPGARVPPAAAEVPGLAAAAAREGLIDEAAGLLADLPEVCAAGLDGARAVEVIAGVAGDWLAAGDRDRTEALLGEVVTALRIVEAIPVVERPWWAWPELARMVVTLGALGQPDAAAEVNDLVAAYPVGRPGFEELAATVRAGAPLWAPAPHSGADSSVVGSAATTSTGPAGPDGPDAAPWHHLSRVVRALLVEEVAADHVALLPMGVGPWWGQGVELHGAPTVAGRLSMAVRWHDTRPALLWELEAVGDAAPVTLTCPALDPSFATTEARGETLLGAVPPPPEHPGAGASAGSTDAAAESMAPRSVLPPFGASPPGPRQRGQSPPSHGDLQ